MKIRIGHLSTFYHTAILLMAQGGTDSRIGAPVEWRLMGTGPAIMQAFRNGELDMAYIGLPPAIIGISTGVAVACVAGGHLEGTVMAGKSEWQGFAELDDPETVFNQFRGRRIGVPGKGSIHDVILKDCLEHYGLGREIEIVNYPWADMVTEAVVKNEVSAAFGTPALAIALKRFANGKILYPASRLWPDNPSYGIAADRDFLAKEPEMVSRFIKIHEDATRFIRERPREAAQAVAEYVGIVDTQFVLDTFLVSPRYCAKLTEAYVASTMKFVPVLKRLGYIKNDVAEDVIFSRESIDRVHPEQDHYGDGIASA